MCVGTQERTLTGTLDQTTLDVKLSDNKHNNFRSCEEEEPILKEESNILHLHASCDGGSSGMTADCMSSGVGHLFSSLRLWLWHLHSTVHSTHNSSSIVRSSALIMSSKVSEFCSLSKIDSARLLLKVAKISL